MLEALEELSWLDSSDRAYDMAVSKFSLAEHILLR